MRNYKRDAKGRFARHSAAKSKYRAAKKANAKAHRSRVKGSVKARGKEIVTTAPRRSKNLVGGAALYAGGRYMGSARAQSLGLDMARQGARAGVGRVGATRAMSRGLKRGRNRAAKDEYYKSIGTTRARRNAAKLAAAGIVGAAALYTVKKEGVYVDASVGKTISGATIGSRRGMVSGSLVSHGGGHFQYQGATRRTKSGKISVNNGFVQFSRKGVNHQNFRV